MTAASRFSLLVFAPVLVAFLLTGLFLLPAGELISFIAILDPTIPLSGAASYDRWVVGPFAAVFGLFLAGRWLHSLHARGRRHFAAWMITWAVFSGGLFLAIWFGLTVLTSVGASDKPPVVFLSWTGGVATVLTLLAQALVVPWLYGVSRMGEG